MNKLLVVLIGVMSVSVRARLLADMFRDGMVLQGFPHSAAIFGKTRIPGDLVTLILDESSVYTAKANAHGAWTIRLPPTPSSFAVTHTITVSSERERRAETLRGVLFGETLYCGGGGSDLNAISGASFARSGKISLTRLTATTAADNSKFVWASEGAYSSACLGKATELSQAANAPVGVIDATGAGPYAVEAVRGAIIQNYAWVKSNNNNNNNKNNNNNNEISFLNAAESVSMRNDYIINEDTFPRIIGHRGSASTCPENTIVSQEVARRGGAVWIEDDTHPTLDGVPIVMHDDNVDRTTDGSGPIRSHTLAEIKALDAGSWFAPIFAGTRVPTLQEQLADLRIRGGSLLLEIKSEHSVEETRKIYEAIRAENMTERVIIQSFTTVDLERMYQVAPELPLGLLTSNIDSDVVGTCKRLHLTHYNPNAASVFKNPGVVKTLHSIGVAIYVWTPDTPADWQKLVDLGVDGIITNRPIELVGYSKGSTKSSLNEGLFDRAPPAANHGVSFFSI